MEKVHLLRGLRAVRRLRGAAGRGSGHGALGHGSDPVQDRRGDSERFEPRAGPVYGTHVLRAVPGGQDQEVWAWEPAI